MGAGFIYLFFLIAIANTIIIWSDYRLNWYSNENWLRNRSFFINFAWQKHIFLTGIVLLAPPLFLKAVSSPNKTLNFHGHQADIGQM